MSVLIIFVDYRNGFFEVLSAYSNRILCAFLYCSLLLNFFIYCVNDLYLNLDMIITVIRDVPFLLNKSHNIWIMNLTV